MTDDKMGMIMEVVIRWLICFGISIVIEMAVGVKFDMVFALGCTSFLYFALKFRRLTILGVFVLVCVPIGLALENSGLSGDVLLYFLGIFPVLEIGWYWISY